MLASKNVDLQIAALKTIPKFASKDSVELLYSVANDSHSGLITVACHGLLELGDRRCLANLVAALESSELATRVESLEILRTVTDKNFRLNVFDSPKKQTARLDKWQSWLAAQGELTPAPSPIQYSKIKLIPLDESLVNGLIAHFTMYAFTTGH